MHNPDPISQSESDLFTALTTFWQLVTGTSTPKVLESPSTSDTLSSANGARKRGVGSVYDDATKAHDKISKRLAVESLPSKDKQPISEQLPDFLNNPLQKGGFPYLSNKDHVNLSASCWQFYSWTLSERVQRAYTLLMLAVVGGNEDEAKRLLFLNSSLLLSKNIEVIDYSGRLIKQLTPFQAALCAGDVEMCEMMKPYFAELTDGQAELESQYHEIFPNGIDAQVELQKNEVFDFTTILNAIKNASDADVQTALNKKFENDTSLNRALNDFREQFHRKSLSEMIYNPQHLLRAILMYYDEYDNLATWDKRDLFWRQVIGFVQRYFPACYAQAFANGLIDIIENKSPLVRSFKFKYGSEIIFPLLRFSDLGFDWVASPGGGLMYDGNARGIGGRLPWPPQYRQPFLQLFVEQKHQACKNLSGQPSVASLNIRP